MEKSKKILSALLALIMMISIVPLSSITASAATYSGSCGDNLTWTFDDFTGTLTISGTGEMYDYNWNIRPWESYKEIIENVVINDGVTSIGMYAFSYCESLTSVTIPDSITTIGDFAFGGCYSLKDVYYGGTEEEWNAISIGTYNEPLLNATIHFTGTGEHTHNYTAVITAPTCKKRFHNIHLRML